MRGVVLPGPHSVEMGEGDTLHHTARFAAVIFFFFGGGTRSNRVGRVENVPYQDLAHSRKPMRWVMEWVASCRRKRHPLSLGKVFWLRFLWRYHAAVFPVG